ncbi:HPP family protein [Streptomyces kunmingensis]|uniref:HPP family protein n=1 Tax=Streptomyces kunmingensis TaxID=68225 RepID=A0ABU6C905_9ACTN|nr:HPP family protein [Streptomyces kunmingensis]MEB3961208.1 HPP family protein [Streptomyces kunmingensis]
MADTQLAPPTTSQRIRARLRGRAPVRNPAAVTGLATAAGVTGLTLLVAIGVLLHRPVLIPPLAASAALVFAAPTLPLAQPRCVIGGQLVSGTVGLICLSVAGNSLWTAGAAGGLAIGAMALSRTSHSPAAATAVIAVMTEPPAPQFIALLALATVVLVTVGVAAGRMKCSAGRYPVYWW